MAWRVKQGLTVHHDGGEYKAGDTVPCTDAQAAQMPHAVVQVQVPLVVENRAPQKRK